MKRLLDRLRGLFSTSSLSNTEGEEHTDDEEEQVREKLRDLGYM